MTYSPYQPQSYPEQAWQPPPPPPMTKWPKVMGGTLLAFAGCGLLLHCCTGVVTPLTMPLAMAQSGMMAQSPIMEQNAEQVSAMMPYRWGLFATGTYALLCSVILMIGAFMLLARRPGVRSFLLLWALLKAISALGGGAFNAYARIAAVRETGGGPAASEDMMIIATLLGAAMATAWFLALPIFIATWFSRRSIRNEVTMWT